ncbi:MAG: DUF2892 domain-containing protein [Granulosicoccaceae bacterium]|jgi:hypothetical protein
MTLQTNLGGIDRIVRTIIGALLIYLGLFATDLITNQVVRYMLVVFGVINIITAIIAFCPMYALANISTLPKSDD